MVIYKQVVIKPEAKGPIVCDPSTCCPQGESAIGTRYRPSLELFPQFLGRLNRPRQLPGWAGGYDGKSLRPGNIARAVKEHQARQMAQGSSHLPGS